MINGIISDVIKGVIDRIEGDIAVVELESGEMININTNDEKLESGLCVCISNGTITNVSYAETYKRRLENEKKLAKILSK